MKRRRQSQDFSKSVNLFGSDDNRDVLILRKKSKNQAYVILLTQFAAIGVPCSPRTKLRHVLSDILQEMAARQDAAAPHGDFDILDLNNNAIHINDTPLSFFFGDKFSYISRLSDCVIHSLSYIFHIPVINLISEYVDATKNACSCSYIWHLKRSRHSLLSESQIKLISQDISTMNTCSLHNEMNLALDHSIERYMNRGYVTVTMATTPEGLFLINPYLNPVQIRFDSGKMQHISADFISKHIVDKYVDVADLDDDEDDHAYDIRRQMLLHAGVYLELHIDGTTMKFPIHGALGNLLHEAPSTSQVFQNALDCYALEDDSQQGTSNPLNIAKSSSGGWKSVLPVDKVVGARMTFVVSRCEVTLQKPVGDVLFVDHISHEIANAMVKACFGRRDYDEDEGGIVLHVQMIRGIRARLHVPCTRGIFESVFNNVVEQIRHMKVTELNIHLSGSIASQPIISKLREYDSFTEIMTTLMSDIPNIVSKFEIFYLN